MLKSECQSYKNMKLLLSYLIFFIFTYTSFCQIDFDTNVEEVNKEELLLKQYKNDSLANALVLFEKANLYIDEENEYKFRTDYFFRIKLFNKDAFSRSDIVIPTYKEEEVLDIQATTYNLVNDEIVKTKLEEKDIFVIERDEFWTETKFTFPNVSEGAIIEYSYSIISPYSQLDDWYFQSDIPKIKSEFNASILGNFDYNFRLFGYHPLSKNFQSVKKNCMYIPNFGSGGCALYSLSMDLIPAFVEEKHMTSKDNYRSRLVWDLKSFTNLYNRANKYTNTWADADETLKKRFLDNQIDKERYFKRKLPENILSIKNKLTKAKAIYKYIQKSLFWDKTNRSLREIDIKNVFKEKNGSADALNLILYNSLKASGLETNIVVLSTRENGLITKVYPNVKDFNYLVVKLNIDDKTYLLDVTEKTLPFGQLPFRCLNGEGRVLDIAEESYWIDVSSGLPSFEHIKLDLTLEDDFKLKGDLTIISDGYFSSDVRDILKNNPFEQYQNNFQNLFPNLSLKNFSLKNQHELEEKLIQNFEVTFNSEIDNRMLYSPFVLKNIVENPFTLKERKYPVNFGYPRTYAYSVSIKLPNKYKVNNLPENKNVKLSNSGGGYLLKVSQEDNKILLFSELSFNKHIYFPNEYVELRDFYDEVIKAQSFLIEVKE